MYQKVFSRKNQENVQAQESHEKKLYGGGEPRDLKKMEKNLHRGCEKNVHSTHGPTYQKQKRYMSPMLKSTRIKKKKPGKKL